MKSENHPLPELTHLQFAVLTVLGTAQMSGKDLRTGLWEIGLKRTGPSFYQMMSRLEEAKFVNGWYSQEIISGQIIKQRQYAITDSGVRALNRAKNFYMRGSHKLGLGFAHA
jgi:DNA-binding PadR family transcriptional regulator